MIPLTKSTAFARLVILLSLATTIVLGGCIGNARLPNTTSSTTTDGGLGSGTPTAAAVLSISNQSVSFGDVMVGTATSRLISLTNSGSSNLNISGVSVSGAGYSVSGGSNVTLVPAQTVTISVNFGPSTSGYAGGTLAVVSNAANALVQVGISGNGITTQPTTHGVTLSWTPPTSSFAGFFVYRSTVSGGPYTKLNAVIDTLAMFDDAGLASGTYYYVVTTVDSNGVESGFSNEVQVVIP
jgi:L-fucose isomerase-like protein